jgi:hypothetical protein
MREVHILLDGELIATLLPGQSVTREVAPGTHRLRANNTFIWKTVESDARPGEHVQFVTGNRSGFGSWMVWVLGAGPLYVTPERVSYLLFAPPFTPWSNGLIRSPSRLTRAKETDQFVTPQVQSRPSVIRITGEMPTPSSRPSPSTTPS